VAFRGKQLRLRSREGIALGVSLRRRRRASTKRTSWPHQSHLRLGRPSGELRGCSSRW